MYYSTKPNEPGQPAVHYNIDPPPVARIPIQAWPTNVGPLPMAGIQMQPWPTNVGPLPMAGIQMQPWTTGLCGCCEDCNSCCLTFWCPCITFGRIAHITDRGLTSCWGSATLCSLLFLFVGFHWIYTCIYRKNLRMLYNLPETPCCDCCVDYCCEFCSLSQMYRELQNRGFNMSLGYQENLQSLGQVNNMQPPQGPGTMMR